MNISDIIYICFVTIVLGSIFIFGDFIYFHTDWKVKKDVLISLKTTGVLNIVYIYIIMMYHQ